MHLNRQPLFTGKSAFRFRDPGFLGIMDVENDAVFLRQFEKGPNELVLAVSVLFWRLGIDLPVGRSTRAQTALIGIAHF